MILYFFQTTDSDMGDEAAVTAARQTVIAAGGNLGLDDTVIILAQYLDRNPNHAVLVRTDPEQPWVAVFRGAGGDLDNFYYQELPLEEPDADGGDLTAMEALRAAINLHAAPEPVQKGFEIWAQYQLKAAQIMPENAAEHLLEISDLDTHHITFEGLRIKQPGPTIKSYEVDEQGPAVSLAFVARTGESPSVYGPPEATLTAQCMLTFTKMTVSRGDTLFVEVLNGELPITFQLDVSELLAMVD